MSKTILTHGGDWAGYKKEYDEMPLDFSMNINPLGMPERAVEAIGRAAADAVMYPDPLCRELREKLSRCEKIPAEWIFCGNGAADIIFRLAAALKPEGKQQAERKREGDSQAELEQSEDQQIKLKPEGDSQAELEQSEDQQIKLGSGMQTHEIRRPQLLITAPTFSEYEAAFAGNGWQIKRSALEEKKGFRIDSSFLEEIDDCTDAVFLCEPNNPTGITTERPVLELILEKCRQTGTFLVIDECFNGFLDDPDSHSMKGYLEQSRELIILKAFTKIYGMPGVRLGYCLCSDSALVERLTGAGQPWAVSLLAQAAGMGALQDEEHVRRGREIVKEERQWLREQLISCGIDAVHGEANYLFFRYTSGPLPLDRKLREHGILIRNCSNFHGLGDGWFRIAVRKHEDNMKLIAALREE